jgi:hypothetical protein
MYIYICIYIYLCIYRGDRERGDNEDKSFNKYGPSLRDNDSRNKYGSSQQVFMYISIYIYRYVIYAIYICKSYIYIDMDSYVYLKIYLL